MLNVNILNSGNVSGAGGDGYIQLGIITVAADFPTLAQANASINRGFYLVAASVTDNDPAKTNTGDSFTVGEQIAWGGSAWVPTEGSGAVDSVNSGSNITVNNGDPANPIVDLNPQIALTTSLFSTPTFALYGDLPAQNLNIYSTQCQITTTDDTPTIMPVVNMAENSCVKIYADVLAVRTGGDEGSAVDTAASTIIGTFKNVGGVVTQVGGTDRIGEVSNIVGANISFLIDGQNIRILVTGAVDTNITWNANEIKVSIIQL